jgi:hypothetical protein
MTPSIVYQDIMTPSKKSSRRAAVAAAIAAFGPDVEVYGILSTVGRASGPYARDGRKEFQAIVRRAGGSYTIPAEILVNETAPTAAEAWTLVLAAIAKSEAPR